MRPFFVMAVVIAGGSFACSGARLAPGEAAGADPPMRAVPEADAPEDAAPDEDDASDEPTLPSPVRELGEFRRAGDPCAAPAVPGLYHIDTEFEGTTSRALLYVPSTPGPHDLVVLLHAGSATPQKILGQTRFSEQAERDGFVVLAPLAADVDGRGPHWNSGKFSTVVEAEHLRDDVAFLDALTRRVKGEICAQRVLVAGFSSGGQMAHRWGCEGREVDGVLTAAGELLVPASDCHTPRAVRGYVGTADKVFDGPPLEGSDQPSAPETIEMWAGINGCNDKPPIETRDAEVTCREWQGCEASTQLCVIEGFPHGWPSPWHRKKPIRANATADGIAWFRSTTLEEPERKNKKNKKEEPATTPDDGRESDGQRPSSDR